MYALYLTHLLPLPIWQYIFPNTTYYVAVVDSIILSADFTFNAKFDPMPAPSIASLKVCSDGWEGGSTLQTRGAGR